MDGGELLQGAGEFTQLGRLLREEEWAAFKAERPLNHSVSFACSKQCPFLRGLFYEEFALCRHNLPSRRFSCSF